MNNTKKTLTSAAIGLASGVALMTSLAFCLPDAPAPAPTSPPADSPIAGVELNGAPLVIPACPMEDSTNCFWNASTQGNGQGRSFIDWEGVAYFAE